MSPAHQPVAGRTILSPSTPTGRREDQLNVLPSRVDLAGLEPATVG